jgi:hypothetical protein
MQKKLSNNTILILIVLLASVLRFYKYFEIPYTHDEFSAIFRTYFNSFAELIDKGAKIDGHPAGIQTFLYYYTKAFGYTEWIVKLPFTLFGIISVLLIYRIGKEWYNETVGLISAAFLSSIQYTVMYSNIARPYISGLFFSLLMVYFWTNLVRLPQKRFYQNSALFIVSASLCTYNHHFSALFAVIVGFSGLLFIQRKYLLKYILSGLIIVLLYIPHFGIFLYQYNLGGVEGWLAKPRNDFFINYIYYVFNYSWLSIGLTISLVIYGFIGKNKLSLNYKSFILFLSWFLLPFLIGFFYSRYVNAVLQFSVLIFSFPYLLFLLFGHIKEQKVLSNLYLVIIIFVINIFSLAVNRKHFNLFYNSPYKQLLVDNYYARNNNDSILSIIDSHKRISEFYYPETNIDTNFIWLNSFEIEKNFSDYLKEQSQFTNYLYFGGTSGNNPITVPIIMEYYPTIEWQKNYAGSTSYLFSKKPLLTTNFIEFYDFETKAKEAWTTIDLSKFIDTASVSGNSSYFIDSTIEWSPTFSKTLKETITNKNNFIDISVKVYMPNGTNEQLLVASIDAKDENIYWGGTSFDRFITDSTQNNAWITIHHSIKFSDMNTQNTDIKLKVFVWNKGKKNFLIDDFKVELREGNPVIYGLVERIP